MGQQQAAAAMAWLGSGRRPAHHERVLTPAVPSLPAWVMRLVDIVCGLLAGYLGVSHIGELSGLSEVWIFPAVLLARLAVLEPEAWRIRRLWSALALPSSAFLLGGLLAGESVGRLAWMAAANILGILAGVALFRHDRQRSWLARDLDEFVWLWAACGLATMVTLALGGYPNVYVGSGADRETVIWCALRQFAVLASAANCVLPLYFRPAADLLRPMPRSWWLPFLAASVACLSAPYAWPGLSLSWLVVVPAVAAGALMTLRAASIFVLTVGVTSMFMPYPAYEVDPLFGVLRPEAAVDLLLVFVSHATVLILVFRQHGAALLAAYGGYAQGVSAQREMRDGVLQSMSDGLLLTDRSGRVLLSNGALAYLVGGVPPDLVSLEWVRQVELQADSVDRVLSATEFTRLLRPRAGGISRNALVVPGGPTGSRRLAVTTRDVLSGEEPLTLWLFRDVTADYARERELELFAGTVANDLKAPLSSLSVWMGTAEDEFADDDAEAGRYAMDQAQAAIRQMRWLIDEYLAQAVGRGGSVTLTDIPLADVVGEICAVYQAEVENATFDLDVPHVVHADAALTRQLLANLIGQGVQHHGEGQPPYVRVRSLDELPGWAEVRIAHTCRTLQLAPAGPAAVAEPAGSGGPAGPAGHGEPDARTTVFGLAVCTAIVTRHGGHLSAEDNEWGGSTFRFTLPLAVVSGLA